MVIAIKCFVFFYIQFIAPDMGNYNLLIIIFKWIKNKIKIFNHYCTYATLKP